MYRFRKNAAAVIENSEGLILVGERSDIAGAWQLPQGGIDEGETPEQAVLREVVEETGISAEFLQIVSRSSEHSYLFPKHCAKRFNCYDGQVQIYFRIKIADSGWKLQKSSEFVNFEWVTRRRVIERIHELKKDCYIKAFYELFGEKYE